MESRLKAELIAIKMRQSYRLALRVWVFNAEHMHGILNQNDPE